VLLGERGDPGGQATADTRAWVKNTCTVVTDDALGVSDCSTVPANDRRLTG
jgi:hypothetical protein